MAVEDLRVPCAQRPQRLERAQHRLAVVEHGGQVQVVQRSTEVAGVRGEDDLAVIAADAQGLVSRRVPPGRDADHRAVAEEIVLAVHHQHVVTQVVVAGS